jgi:hypothetical protein
LPGFGHVRGVPHRSVFAYGENTFFAIRAKNQREYLRNRVVEFPAGLGRFKRTIGTRTEFLIDVAGSDFTPVLTLYLLTTGAFSGNVLPAGSAIQSAEGNQLRIVFYFSIHFTSI